MPWRLTENLEAFTTAVEEQLRSDPVRNTVPLTVLESLRQSGMSAFGDSPPLFGWHESASGGTDGAFLQTPPFPPVIARIPAGAATSLVELITGGRPQPAGVNLPESDAAEFSSAWTQVTGGTATVHVRMRLYRLAHLTPPVPSPPGAARMADQSDYDLLVAWNREFFAQTGAGGEDAGRNVTDRIGYGGITVWQDAGRPVAMAARTRQVAGVCRVASVYTPPEYRGRGYGGGATTAVTQQALHEGAAEVVLFADLANATSNALYQRLGYEAVMERTALDLR